MGSNERTYKGKLGDWEKLNTMMGANSADLAHLEATRARFEILLNQARDAAARQATFTAGKQDASQQLRTFIVEGDRLANLLRRAVKQHYGIRSEKIAEFGMQPFRGRTRKVKALPDEGQPPAPAAADPTP